MPGQTRLPLGARHFRLPLSPRSATTSYAPQITSGWPSPSRSATAGEEYQPVWQYGPGKQPPYCHFKTGALTTATLKWTGNGTATSSPPGINCGATCSAAYDSGTVVTLAATPAAGSTFSSWSGCNTVSGTICTVTMTAARSVTATFNVAVVSAPVLKWQYGGCLPGPYCQTGWYSSPAVTDLDGDGQPDVIWGAYDVVALRGDSGRLKWRAPSGNRGWPGIAVADLTGDGTLEVVVARDSDQLTVYNRFGNVAWTRNPFSGGQLRPLAVTDLETGGQLEIIVGQAAGLTARQLNVLAPNGTVRPGWPARHDGEPGDSFGMWNQNVTVADMHGDGFKEVFVPGGHY